MKVARDALAASQDAAAARTDPLRREVKYEVGDKVLVHKAFLRPPSLDSIAVAAKTKTRFKFSGPYRVAQLVGPNAVRLDNLPATFRGHPVFNVAALKPFHESTVPERSLPLLSQVDPAVEDGMDAWLVGSVLGSAIRRGSRRWLVRWAGLGEAHDSWEPLSSFVSSAGVSQAPKEFERSATGDLTRLNTLLAHGDSFCNYPSGTPGATKAGADGFDLYYVDNPGETLSEIANRYAATARQLQRWNRSNIVNLRRDRMLPPGTAIRVAERAVQIIRSAHPIVVLVSSSAHGWID